MASAVSWQAVMAGPYILGTDDRSKIVKANTWRLYSDDLIDTTGGQKIYVSRNLADSCGTVLYFHEKDSLTQVDSCINGAPTITGGVWHFYSNNGDLYGFGADVKTLPGDEPFKLLYSLSNDTMQLEIRPGLLVDTVEYHYLLRAKTFISH